MYLASPASESSAVLMLDSSSLIPSRMTSRSALARVVSNMRKALPMPLTAESVTPRVVTMVLLADLSTGKLMMYLLKVELISERRSLVGKGRYEF
jgi:hypothetical protein